MRYLCLVYPRTDFRPEEADRATFLALIDEMSAAGAFVASGALHPPGSATTLRVRDGETVLTDGPFAEMAEHVGGYLLLDCADLDQAVAWAARLPAFTGDVSIEIRPLIDFAMPDGG